MEGPSVPLETPSQGIKIIHPQTSDKNDLIIVCPTEAVQRSDEEKKVSRFGVERSVLARHSTVLGDMFQAYAPKKDTEEITFYESFELVSPFLKLIYGFLPNPRVVWPFDHCIDMIEMGDKYQANCVVDAAISKLCQSIEVISEQPQNKEIESCYKNACIVKFLCVWRQAKEDSLSITSFQLLRLTFSQIWSKWPARCFTDLGGPGRDLATEAMSPSGYTSTRTNTYPAFHTNLRMSGPSWRRTSATDFPEPSSSSLQLENDDGHYLHTVRNISNIARYNPYIRMTFSQFIHPTKTRFFSKDELSFFNSVLERINNSKVDIMVILKEQGFFVGKGDESTGTNSFI